MTLHPAGRVDPDDREFYSDTHGVVARAREIAPVARTAGGDPVFLGYEVGFTVLNSPDLATAGIEVQLAKNGITSGLFYELATGLLLAREGVDHQRLRRLLTRVFTPRQVERIRDEVRERVQELLAGLPEGEPVDWLRLVADDLPVWTICELIGVPSEDRGTFSEWTSTFAHALSHNVPAELHQRAEAASVALIDYLENLLEEVRRRGADPDDETVIANLVRLAEEGVKVDQREVLILVTNMLIGGQNPVRSLLSFIPIALAENPEEFAALRRDPELAKSAVEEVLRYEAPIVITQRRARRDTTIGGVEIAEGQVVHVCLAGGNRDPEHFERADKFEITRTPERPLSFGSGAHHCVGNMLGRLEAQEVVRELAVQFERLELAEPVEVTPYIAVRRVNDLQLVLKRAAAQA